ncbi:transcriptional regulator, TetR family [Pseudomonas sp. ok272]|uniref:TetR/AcrR family transcriptional regulator n=1 Tax=unclassified Pseudomonas TaxID=196821 RepID=UPI0008C15FA1|nr:MULTISPECIES: TetR/AcrR family transcriptional regulator [unclassified Pseudomonas]SEN11364.1 transcriptional regulator, TetR family [Pseudomonas sp. ok272]SFN04449.1 transcriptional regulator, TetR family [Pseudomonas sp. ok602]
MPTHPNHPAPSLRERKKEKFRQLLINTAIELFRERGFTHTRMEDIAAVAESGVTTVYNYFPNKHTLLIAIIENQVALAQEAVSQVVNALPEDPREAFVDMIAADYGDMDTLEDKRLWRELLAAMLFAVEEHAQIGQARNRFKASLKLAIEAYVARGTFAASVDIEALIDVVYAIYAFHFRSLACSDTALTADTLILVRRDIRLLLSGLTSGDRQGRAG